MEKRNFTRIPFQAVSTLKSKHETLKGDIDNLSLNGMFVRTPQRLPLDEAVDIDISLSGKSSRLSISLLGSVVRHDEDGIAIQFRGMDLDSFIHLKNMIAYYGGDERRVLEEFFEFMKHDDQKGY